MKPHYAFTADHLQNLPPNLRALIGKHFADSRWVQTCIFYRRLSERYRRTLCFHAALHHRWCVYQLEEMDEMARERIVSALNELRSAFGLPENQGQGQLLHAVRLLTLSERRTLFFHAGLTTQEFDQPLRRIDESDCRWAKTLNLALGELHSLFAEAPDILTSIKPEHYFRSEHYFRPE
ncbi:replication protein B [Dickeya dianthicola]|uniref:replication protein B n=1 Tax=Dickeya dianthicola TaxID=204039 RepID=UPI001F60E1D6|nr:replication protein B [Dickeya dianthicola]MCI4202628.1 replication protein B [Dickeya dianthicola]